MDNQTKGTRRNQHFGARHFAYARCDVVVGSECIEGFVRCGVVEEQGDVKADTVGQLKVGVDVPLVLCIEAELSRLHDGGVAEVTACQFGVGVLIRIFIGCIVQEVVQRVEVP